MPLYESVFIARQDISGAQVDALADGFAEIVTNGGGQIAKREYWGLRNLAYRIKKNRKGHYVLFNIDAPSATVHEMERLMRINDDILRFLTLRVDEHDPEPSVMMQGKSSERRERADRGEERRQDDAAPASADAKPAEAAAADAKPADAPAADAKPADAPAADAKPADAEAKSDEGDK